MRAEGEVARLGLISNILETYEFIVVNIDSLCGATIFMAPPGSVVLPSSEEVSAWSVACRKKSRRRLERGQSGGDSDDRSKAKWVLGTAGMRQVPILHLATEIDGKGRKRTGASGNRDGESCRSCSPLVDTVGEWYRYTIIAIPSCV